MQKSRLPYRLAAALAFGVAFATGAVAQTYPDRPIKVIVPYPAGGVLDSLTRAIGDYARSAHNQSWIIENRVGASGTTGLQACAQAAPDGYTICPITAEALSVTPFYDPKLYDRYKALTPVSQFVSAPGVIYAHPSVKANTLPELLALAKANPKDVTYSSWGLGTAPHLIFEWLKKKNDIEILHVPFKGSSDAFNEVLAGRISASYVTVGFVRSQIEQGALKPIAVIGDERSALLPNTPSLKELGVPFPYKGAWFGMMAPENTPLELREKIATIIRAAMQDKALQARFLDPQGYRPVGSMPRDFEALIKEEMINGEEIVRIVGLQKVE